MEAEKKDSVAEAGQELQTAAGSWTEKVDKAARLLKEESKLAGEEFVGAEILLGKELTENLGIMLEFTERLNEIGQQQLRWFVSDAMLTLTSVATAGFNPLGAGSVVGEHFRRRSEHVLAGWKQWEEAVEHEQHEFLDVVTAMWRPFFAVMERDWRTVG